MKISIATSTKLTPVMPLTSLPDNGMPGCPHVTRIASTAKIMANINTSKPITIFSILIFSPPFLSDSFLKERKILFFCIFLYMVFVGSTRKNTAGIEYTSLQGTSLGPKDSVFAQYSSKKNLL